MSQFRDPACSRLSFLASGAALALLVAASSMTIPALGQSVEQPATPQPPPPQPAGPAPAPICDAACVRQNMDRAAQACAPRIEARAPTDFDWLTRPFAGIFQQAEPPEQGKSLVQYRGDSIRFLSPEKEWVRVSYECVFDVAAQGIVHVNVRLGRLDMPQTAAAGGAPAQSAPAAAAPQMARMATPAPRPVAQPAPQVVAAPRKLTPSEPNEIEVRQVNPRAVPHR